MSDNIANRLYIEQSSGTSSLVEIETPQTVPPADPIVTTATIIWTPRFIVLFASLCVLGLSAASILTQIWLNGLLRAEAIQLFYTVFALGSSLLIALKAQRIWTRIGGIFAFIWSLLMGLHFAIPAVSQLDPHTSLVAHLDIATQCAFLGAATCFTAFSTPFRRWDTWFFCLLPPIGAAIVGLNILLIPTDLPAGNFNESMIVTALLYLSIIIWWLRPANWRGQSGVAFLGGIMPLLQIVFTGSGYQADDVAFFMTLVVLLVFLLLNLRILQGEGSLLRK